MKERIREHALALGFDTVGFCSADPPSTFEALKQWTDKGYHGTMEYMVRHLALRKDPRELLDSARTVVAVTQNYKQVIAHEPGRPRIATYALGRDYHKTLRGRLRSLGRWIEQEQPGAEWRACVDSAPIMEREYANRAGLGWYGKNTCLIDTKRGSWFVIGILLTSLEIRPDKPAKGGCGTCTKCIEACPTQAIVYEQDRWQVDARRCISYLTIEHKGDIAPELQSKMGDWTFGCDVCQQVCPFNEQREHQPARAKATTERDFLKLREWPDLKELAQIDQHKWDELTRGSAVRRAGLEGIKRNARINLANLQT